VSSWRFGIRGCCSLRDGGFRPLRWFHFTLGLDQFHFQQNADAPALVPVVACDGGQLGRALYQLLEDTAQTLGVAFWVNLFSDRERAVAGRQFNALWIGALITVFFIGVVLCLRNERRLQHHR